MSAHPKSFKHNYYRQVVSPKNNQSINKTQINVKLKQMGWIWAPPTDLKRITAKPNKEKVMKAKKHNEAVSMSVRPNMQQVKCGLRGY